MTPSTITISTELQLLVWACALGLLHVLATVVAGVAQHGLRYILGSRDEQKPLQGMPARLDRAFRNFLETFPFFIAAVLLAQVLGKHSALTVLGAQLYVWARLAYIPLYLSGVPALRTLCWTAAFAGIVLVLAG